MKRQLAAALAALILLAGCGGDRTDDTGAATDAPSASDLVEANFQGEQAILTVDGEEISVTTYFYIMGLVIDSLIGDTALDDVDWGATYGEMTLSEYITALTLAQIKQYCAVAAYAEGLGLGLTDGQREQIAADYLDMTADIYAQYNSESAARQVIDLYMPEEAITFLLAADHYMDNLAEGLYGGEAAPADSEITAYMAQAGYYRTTYLYYSYLDSSGSPLGDEAVEEKRVRAVAVLEELEEAADPVAALQALIVSEGEDEIIAEMAEGYYFTESDVDTGFYTIISSLAEGEISPVIEAEDGCMIAVRLPLLAEDLKEQYAALNIQESLISLRTSATVHYSDLYAYANPRSYCYWIVYQADAVGS